MVVHERQQVLLAAVALHSGPANIPLPQLRTRLLAETATAPWNDIEHGRPRPTWMLVATGAGGTANLIVDDLAVRRHKFERGEP